MIWESPTMPWDLCSPERQDKLRVAWGAGNLRWKLDPSQQLMYDQIYLSHHTVKSSAERVFCLDVSRQSGKDFIMSTIAIETCLRNRRALRIPYAAPTKDTVKELLVPTMEAIFQDCPPELLPMEIRKGTFRGSSTELSWPWGARIPLVGVDLHPDWLRGPATYAFMFTEPAFVEGLEDLMGSVLLPQMLTQPQGFGVMGSTPPVSPGHAWTTKYVPAAKARGMYAKRTIYDCPRFSEDQVKGMIQELGGLESTRVRRELLVEHIIESTLAVIPEYAQVKNEITRAPERVPYYRDTYVGIDPGFSHGTGAVGGYFDFDLDRVVIEWDACVQRLNSREVARIIKAREWQIWGRIPTRPEFMTDPAWATELELMKGLFYAGTIPLDTPVSSYRDKSIRITTTARFCGDDAPRLIADLQNEHNLTVLPARRDDAEAAMNALRVKIQAKKYLIHPRCGHLISHLEQATWNKSRTKLAESSDGGHFDCIPALVNLNRGIYWGKNPSPAHNPSSKDRHVPAHVQAAQGKTAQALTAIFGKGRKR